MIETAIIDILVIIATENRVRCVYLSMQVEAELSELALEERQEYLKSLGVSESGLGNLIRATYDLLGLRTYFTSGEKVRENLEIFSRSFQFRVSCFIKHWHRYEHNTNIDPSNNLRKLNN